MLHCTVVSRVALQREIKNIRKKKLRTRNDAVDGGAVVNKKGPFKYSSTSFVRVGKPVECHIRIIILVSILGKTSLTDNNNYHNN